MLLIAGVVRGMHTLQSETGIAFCLHIKNLTFAHHHNANY